MNTLDINHFLQKRANGVVVDVRTPDEFDNGHIPGASNIPLFDNHERAVVGTIYKKQGRDEAVMKGLEFAQHKLVNYVKQAKKIAGTKPIYAYCWRGGMRSASLAWLFNTAGLTCKTLTGGYKAYRRFIRESFSKKAKIIILSGKTGSGKTDMLYELQKQGEQIIDLEGLAHHKGSAFGAFGQKIQPTTEQFENNLYEKWCKTDLNKHVWIEDESYGIGCVNIPEPLYEQMRNTDVIVIDVSKQHRIERLVAEYGKFDNATLRTAIDKIKKRLGGQHYNKAVEALDENNLETVADIVLDYYDKAYSFGLSKRNQSFIKHIEAQNNNIQECVKQLINSYKK